MPGFSRRGEMALLRLMAALFAGAAITLSPAVATPQTASLLSTATTLGKGPGSRFPPLVQRTGKPPTGYQVTFRYGAPTATNVRIEGEWYFSSPGRTTTAGSQGLLPKQWRSGDFPIANPNSTA